jgi:type VI protein secretion system component Hcp
MRFAILICLLALAGEVRAAFDVFLRVSAGGNSIAGETADPIYQGWSTVLSFESGASKHTVVGTPSDNTTFSPLTLVKEVDGATPIFFDLLARSTPPLAIKMVVVSRTPQRVEFWDVACQTSSFIAQTFTGGAGQLLERITFLTGSFEWSYTQVSPAGDAVTELFANWSIITGSGAQGTRPPKSLGDTDTDGDGIPDGWESFYGLDFHAADSALDTDGDGLSNLHEFIARTNPRVAESTLRVTAVQKGTPGSYQLSWLSVVGLNYRVESAPAPSGPWTFVKNVASAGTGTTSTVVTGAPPAMFFRVATP